MHTHTAGGQKLVSWPGKENAKPYPPRILSSVFFLMASGGLDF